MKQKGLRLSAVPFNAWMRYSRRLQIDMELFAWQRSIWTVEFEGQGTLKTIFFKLWQGGGFYSQQRVGANCSLYGRGRLRDLLELGAQEVMRAPKSRGKLIRKKPPMTPERWDSIFSPSMQSLKNCTSARFLRFLELQMLVPVWDWTLGVSKAFKWMVQHIEAYIEA